MDMMTNLNAATLNDESLDAERSCVVELQDLQLVLVGGGIGDTQL